MDAGGDEGMSGRVVGAGARALNFGFSDLRKEMTGGR